MDQKSVHFQAKLIQLALYTINDFLFEYLSFFEDLFHGHSRHNDTSLALNNACIPINSFLQETLRSTLSLLTFDNILDMRPPGLRHDFLGW